MVEIYKITTKVHFINELTRLHKIVLNSINVNGYGTKQDENRTRYFQN